MLDEMFIQCLGGATAGMLVVALACLLIAWPWKDD